MKKFDVIGAKKRIGSKRDQLKLSQEELGGRFGMSRAGYSAAENPLNEKVFFTPVQLINLKYELNISYDFILEGIESQNSLVALSLMENGHGRELERLKIENEHLKDKVQMKKQLIDSQQHIIDSLKRENALLTTKV